MAVNFSHDLRGNGWSILRAADIAANFFQILARHLAPVGHWHDNTPRLLVGNALGRQFLYDFVNRLFNIPWSRSTCLNSFLGFADHAVHSASLREFSGKSASTCLTGALPSPFCRRSPR